MGDSGPRGVHETCASGQLELMNHSLKTIIIQVTHP